MKRLVKSECSAECFVLLASLTVDSAALAALLTSFTC